MKRLFPTAGSFIFWVIWPWVVANHTAKYYKVITGKTLCKNQRVVMRHELARITRVIKEADPH